MKQRTNQRAKTRSTKPRVDVYKQVTDTILEHLARGVRPWVKPFEAGVEGGLPLRATGQAYRGINIVLLWCAQMQYGYCSNTWMTYRQAAALGANVRTGERGHGIVFFSVMDREDKATGDAVNIPFARHYTVFNCDQIENLPEAVTVGDDDLPAGPADPGEPNAADAILYATGAKISHGGGQAYYMPAFDRIQLPEFDKFRDAETYSAVLAHELIHWTGASHRLDRRFTDEDTKQAYAREELVAEMGAAFVCASLGIAAEVREDHASYIGSWLKLLHHDKRAIFNAAALAQTATDFLLAQAKPDTVITAAEKTTELGQAA